MSSTFEVTRTGPDEYRVPGVSEERLEEALHLLAASDEVRSENATAVRDDLLRVMLRAGLAPTPPASVAQAQRLALHRQQLLAAYRAYDLATLGALRADRSAGATRTWLSRRRQRSELFTVAHDGGVLVPAFQLDDEGHPRSHVGRVLAALAPLEMSGWELWTWFTAASSWLGGAVPAARLGVDADAVVTAATRFAASAE